MKLGITLVTVLVLMVAFQNCSSDLGPSPSSSNNSQQGAPNPSPTPGPGPLPNPSPSGQVQPNSTNSMSDVKPYNPAANCPAGYGVYDLLNTNPAIPAGTWNHYLCVKPFATGDTSVISDVQIVASSTCPAGTELLVTNAADAQSFTMTYSLCIQRQSLPVTGSFVTYFYLSAPNANCRAGDVARGDATFCSQVANGVCDTMVTVKLCKAIQ